jgi:hypothetical protein
MLQTHLVFLVIAEPKVSVLFFLTLIFFLSTSIPVWLVLLVWALWPSVGIKSFVI